MWWLNVGARSSAISPKIDLKNRPKIWHENEKGDAGSATFLHCCGWQRARSGHRSGEIWIKMMDFVLKMTKFALKMMDFVLKMTDFGAVFTSIALFENMKGAIHQHFRSLLQKCWDCLMIFAWQTRCRAFQTGLHVSKNDEFHWKRGTLYWKRGMLYWKRGILHLKWWILHFKWWILHLKWWILQHSWTWTSPRGGWKRSWYSKNDGFYIENDGIWY